MHIISINVVKNKSTLQDLQNNIELFNNIKLISNSIEILLNTNKVQEKYILRIIVFKIETNIQK